MIRSVTNIKVEDVSPRARKRRSIPSKSAYAGKVVIRHAMEAARKNGVNVGSLELSSDGDIRIVDVKAVPAQIADEFAKWEAEGRL